MDRNVHNSDKKHGGGVLIAVRNNYSSSILATRYDSLEQIYVKVNVGGTVYIIGSIYIPPSQTYDKYEQLCDEIELLLLQYPDRKIILCSDFNLLDWQEAEKNPPQYSQHSSPVNFIIDSFLNTLDL